MDFGWCFFENVEEMPLFVFLHAWLLTQLVFMHTQLYSWVRRYVFKALHAWEWTCVRKVLSKCIGFDLYMWDTWQKPYFAHFHTFFNHLTSICNSNTLFVILASENRCIILSIFILTSKHNVPKFHLNHESNVIFLFAVIIPLCW